MFTNFSELSPVLLVAYSILGLLIAGFLLVFIRYAFIAFFYKNKFYHLGYQSGILGLRNFGQAVKDEILKKNDKIDVKEKISLIKQKLRDLVIVREIDSIEKNILTLKDSIEIIKNFKKDEFLKLEDDTTDSISNRIKMLTGGHDLNELRHVIESISGYINELNDSIGSIDVPKIYTAISKELNLRTNEYLERKDQILLEIKELKSKIPSIEKNLGLLIDKKTEIENDTIKQVIKENKHGDSLALSIKSDFKNLGLGIGLIIIVALLLSLLLADILLMYKLVYDLSAQQIRAGEYFIEGYVSYEVFGIIVSLFLPIVLLVMMEISLRKAKEGRILGYLFKYGAIALSLLSFLVGFGYFIWTRIVGGDGGSIEQIMPFFLFPATLALAYGVEAVVNSKNGFSPISAPLVIIPKSVIYSLYISWKRWQISAKRNNQKKLIENQIIEVKNELTTVENSIENNELTIEGLREERDMKILGEVRKYIDIEGSIQNISKNLHALSSTEDNIGAAMSFSNLLVKDFNETFIAIKNNRKTNTAKLEKKIQILKKNKDDIEQGFEYAMKKKLIIT